MFININLEITQYDTEDIQFIEKPSMNITFSSSLSEAGDTSECRLSSGDRGGARPALLPPLPSLASE